MMSARSWKHRSIAAGVAGLAVALALVGCSSTSGSTPMASSTASGAGSSSFFTTVQSEDAKVLSSVTVNDAARAALPASVRSSGTLVVGTQISAPETFYAPNSTTLIGDETTLIQAISKALGLTAKPQVVQFDELIPGLTSKRFNATIGAMNDTSARQATVRFIDYYNAGVGFIVRKGNPAHVTSPSSLCGLSVNVQLGTTQEALAKSQSTTCEADGKKPVKIVYAQSNAQQQVELQSGRVDVYIADSPTAAYVAAQHPDQFEQADASQAIDPAPYGIGVNPSDAPLATAIQKALQGLIDSGAYGQILKNWGLSSGALSSATINAGK